MARAVLLFTAEGNQLKFLVTTTPRRLQIPPVALIEAARAWINARLADKTIDCCYGFTTGGGVSIINADAPEAIAQLLMEYPAYMASDWKVEALCDINKNLDQTVAMVQRVAG
jgi:hypothetical protein